MKKSHYAAPDGGLPLQHQLAGGRSIFTDAFMVMPRGVMTDIVAGPLPFWDKARFWVLARPLSGFAETFSQYIGEVEPGGGSIKPEANTQAQSAIFVTSGSLEIHYCEKVHQLTTGGFAYLPAGSAWTLHNRGTQTARFHWVRKRFERVDGLEAPSAVFSHDDQIVPTNLPGHEGTWMTSKLMDPNDIRYDMTMSIVTIMPGGSIPFMETHVMEHGLYVLQGHGVYKLNDQWIEVEHGDFMWLRAFCPQACYAGGPEPFRYLLYKDINRHARLHL
ncbi:bifunctional allantoicase/(S)-ureidoglycine aminohydrolase [Bartonella sp. LJL80]